MMRTQETLLNYLEIALANASKGYPVFPAQRENKRPMRGFMDWEANATTDLDQIKEWWTLGDWLPAVAPGRVGLAVIDVDRHPGQPDGFETLDREGVTITSKVFGTSISGNGTHYWHRQEVNSLNGVLESVDRKAKGGYVVVPYLLPEQSEITEALPEKLAGGLASSNIARRNLSSAQLNSWLYDVGQGNPDDEMWAAVEKMQDRGHQQMIAAVSSVVSLAAKGHPGASKALDRMQDKWMEGVHNSGDPEVDFLSAVRSAIEKFGEREPDTTPEERMLELLNPTPLPVDTDALKDSLLQHCITYAPRFLDLLSTNQTVRDAFVKCVSLAEEMHTPEEARNWKVAATAAMRRVLDREQETDK